MNTILLPRLLLIGCLGLSGCVSTRHQIAPFTAIPSEQLDIQVESPPVAATLWQVVVRNGPGSWKREAFWDEYVVTFVNRGEHPVTLRTAALVDGRGAFHLPGHSPWKLEEISHRRLNVASEADTYAIWEAGLRTASGALHQVALMSAQFGGASPLLGPGFVVLAATSAVVAVMKQAEGRAKRRIEHEFNARCIVLPAVLLPGEIRTGSLFFPITSGAKWLTVWFHEGAGLRQLRLPLDGSTSPAAGAASTRVVRASSP